MRQGLYSEAFLNACADSFARLSDGGTFEIWAGELPLSVGQAPNGILLSVHQIPIVSAPPASNGQVVFHDFATSQILASSLASFYRFKDANGEAFHQGTVGTALDDANFTVGNRNFIQGLDMDIKGFIHFVGGA